MKHFFRIALACAALFAVAPAFADKPAPVVKGKAPPAEQPAKKGKKKPPERAKTVETAKPFDLSGLGPADAASDKEVAGVLKGCVASPMSREGPSPAQQAKCSAATARLVARGKMAAPSILAKLNTLGETSYFARDRLYFALSKMDDEKVRGVLVAGLGEIADKELSDHASMRWQIEGALEDMMGASPDAAVPWESAAVEDRWAEARNDAARWKTFAAAHAGKTRAQITADHLAAARKAKGDDDAKKAYRAIRYLERRAPAEAVAAAKAYLKRQGLTQEQRAGFEDLQEDAEYRVEESRAAAKRPKSS